MTHRELTYRLHRANRLINNLMAENAMRLAEVRKYKTDNPILIALCGSQKLATGILGSKPTHNPPE